MSGNPLSSLVYRGFGAGITWESLTNVKLKPPGKWLFRGGNHPSARGLGNHSRESLSKTGHYQGESLGESQGIT
jgi:hypothetical protein